MSTTNQSVPADLRRRYARETRQRMDHTISGLRVVQQAGVGNTDQVLEWLSRQEEASRLAGLQGITRLCHDLKDCLAEVRNAEQARLTAVAATLSDVCRTIQLHADTFGTRLPDPSGADEPRHSRATDAAHSMPPAPALARIVEQKGAHRGESPRR